MKVSVYVPAGLLGGHWIMSGVLEQQTRPAPFTRHCFVWLDLTHA